MGYFSNQAIDHDDGREDHSMMPYEFYLRDRLAELRERLMELLENGDLDQSHVLYSELECTLPKHLRNTEDVRAAIDITQRKLWKECFDFDMDYKAPVLAPGYVQLTVLDVINPAPDRAA